MQIKIFTIPAFGGEAMEEALNTFLRSKKVLKVEKQFCHSPQESFWSFCVSYLDGAEPSYPAKKKKVDYRHVLEPEAFARFDRFRAIRKSIAKEENVAPYMIFNDKELAEMAKEKSLTPVNMQQIKGIGPRKVEKYATHFIQKTENEKSDLLASPD